MRMTTNQKELANRLHKSGFSKRDSNIYAIKSSEFVFQTGVAYTSGVLTAATVGAAHMLGRGIGKGIQKLRIWKRVKDLGEKYISEPTTADQAVENAMDVVYTMANDMKESARETNTGDNGEK